ncbi:hypothetical protein [Alkalisalibacterium limincola]|uniref:Uncharacterized protein n=1 Tax=Alkalisalibacterium limincola TaxID=2699169 RepID=A0A5C8KUG2_9GAMM|nr:hypothetical protein [Alkalisalibacterium limincola]TXK64571.1 hypothetical protein FU658_06775 [Alkalisalibacterium limincola]
MNRFPGTVLAVALALAVALLPVVALAQAPEPRMPRAPAALPQALVIEGWWGYPCLTTTPNCFPDAAVDWVPLEVAAWVGDEKFIGGFTSFEGDRSEFEVAVQVPPLQRGDMVMLEVTAQAPEGHVARFTSLQDVAYRLQAAADADGRVALGNRRPNMLTILSTALVGLLEEANGGDWRMDEQQFQRLLRQVDPARLMRHALAFQGLVSGALPGAGTVDPNALVASTDAVEAYLADVPEEVLQAVFEQFQTWGSSAYQPIDFEGLDLTLAPGASPGTIAFGRRAGVRMRLRDEWEEQGGFSTVIDTGLVRGLTTFFELHIDSLQRAARVVRPGQPSFESQRITYECAGQGEVQALRITGRNPFMFRRMAMAGALEFVEYTELNDLGYRAIEGDVVPCVETLPVFEAVRHYAVAYPPRGLARAPVAVPRGPVALQMLNPDPDPMEEDSQFIAGTIDLSTGAVDAPGYASGGTVALGPGAQVSLAVDTLPGSLIDGRVVMRLEGLRDDGLGAAEWGVSSRVEDSDATTCARMSRRWWRWTPTWCFPVGCWRARGARAATCRCRVRWMHWR